MPVKFPRKGALCAALLLLLASCAPAESGGRLVNPAPAPDPTPPAALTPAPTPTPAPAPTPTPAPPQSKQTFVRIRDYIPHLYVELKYAAVDNFTGQVIYDFTDPWLRYGTVEKLMAAQEALMEQGYSLKIWDAYRPVYAQFDLWEAYPVHSFVANPNTGYSSHSRGNTVDLTLVTDKGKPVAMPTGFDEFTALADRDYSDVDPEAAANARLLERAMEAAGFKPYSQEWWHFSDADVYEVEQEFVPADAEG